MGKAWLKFFVLMAILTAGAFFWLEKEEITNEPLRIGTNPWPGYEFLHLAEKKGFFKEEEVSVKLIRFSALEDTRRAFEREQIDGMASTLIELLQANEFGKPAKIVLMTDFSNGSDVIIARKGIKNISDLKDKKVAIEPDSLGVFIVARALEKSGLSLKNVEKVGMAQLNMEQALLSGQVDAIHAYPPYSTDILKHSDKVVKIFDSSEIPGEVVDIISVTPETAAKRIKEIKAIRKAWDKALLFAKQHPDEAYQIMGNIEGISPEEFKDTLDGVKILSIEEQRPIVVKGGTLEQAIANVGTVLRNEGQIKGNIESSNFLLEVEGKE